MTMFPDSDDAKLRMNAYSKMNGWKLPKFIEEDNGTYTPLKLLCGKDLKKSWRDNFTDEDRQICRALVGPYGYAFFKMLCVKRGINISQKAETT